MLTKLNCTMYSSWLWLEPIKLPTNIFRYSNDTFARLQKLRESVFASVISSKSLLWALRPSHRFHILRVRFFLAAGAGMPQLFKKITTFTKSGFDNDTMINHVLSIHGNGLNIYGPFFELVGVMPDGRSKQSKYHWLTAFRWEHAEPSTCPCYTVTEMMVV